ncbi:hypothetical protein BaRGS_00037116 [Batillaria attramentaria]|uniref:Uncharacterized protein n=1 Tax=Batillaria attramentaria TaxID=370345 RepID=A0ABD0J9V7_9CAEN
MNRRDYSCQYGGFRGQPTSEDMSWARPSFPGAEAISGADMSVPAPQLYGAPSVFNVDMQPPHIPLTAHSQEPSMHQQLIASRGLLSLSQPPPLQQRRNPHQHPQHPQQPEHDQRQQGHVPSLQAVDEMVRSTVSAVFQEDKTENADKSIAKDFPETQKGKKRKRDPSEWKKSKNKGQREAGQEYTTAKGKVKKARAVQPIDCSKCRFHCSEKIPEETRQAIHTLYWNLGSYERQRAFIAQHVDQNEVKAKPKVTGRREFANSFFLTHNKKEHRVCKAFFTKTLDIGNKVIDYTLKKTESGVYVGRDERGRKDPGNKTKPEDIEFVHMHIGSFPSVRKEGKNKRKYLSADLNVGKMYSMYKDMCGEVGRKPVSISVYRNVFKKNFNLSFSKPKKEHCPNCNCGFERKKKAKDGEKHTILTDHAVPSSYSSNK